jgi:NAD-dependent SIR2 family protein deacetylase
MRARQRFDADLFIAIGSSLQVFPAAGFPVMAKQNRTPLVIINREETGSTASPISSSMRRSAGPDGRADRG